MGEQKLTKFNLDLTFNESQYKIIEKGYDFGKDMDHKWKIFLKDGWIYFERSWSNWLVYKIKIEPLGSNYKATEAYTQHEIPKDANISDFEQFHADMVNKLLSILWEEKNQL